MNDFSGCSLFPIYYAYSVLSTIAIDPKVLPPNLICNYIDFNFENKNIVCNYVKNVVLDVLITSLSMYGEKGQNNAPGMHEYDKIRNVVHRQR